MSAERRAALPVGWNLERLKFIARVQTGMAKGKDLTGVETVEVPYLRVANVQDGYLDLDDVATMAVPMDDLARYRLRPGDVLMNEGGDFDKLGRGHVWHGQIDPCIHQNHVFAVRPHGVLPEWLNAYTGSAPAQFYFMGQAKQSTNLASISSSNLMELPVPVPPEAVQRRLLAHVERETARIDALVEKKTRFVELLREKRQALITQAVTRGFDPYVAMMDSGVQWLGRIPSHWQVVQVRHVARLGSGHTPSRERPEWWTDCHIPWFTLADVWQVRRERRRFVFDTEEKISSLGVANSSAVVHPAGSVILSRTASVGFPAIMGCDMATSQDFAVWQCGPRLFNEFLYAVLLGMREEFVRVMMGSTHKTIYMPDIEAFRFALPPLHEQSQIVERIERSTQRFDDLIELTEKSAGLLRERRAALITAAVTGQIDIRDAA